MLGWALHSPRSILGLDDEPAEVDLPADTARSDEPSGPSVGCFGRAASSPVMQSDAVIDALLISVRRLAEPAEEQIADLDSIGMDDLVDELALEFDDRYQPAKALLAAAADGSAETFGAVDRALSAPGLGWRYADLHTPAWKEVRAAAAVAAALEARHRRPLRLEAAAPLGL